MTEVCFPAYLVSDHGDGGQCGQVTELTTNELPAGDLLIQVSWSALNYKDALAAQGQKGVVKRLPHVPGIDAAGVVVEGNDMMPTGTQVIVTGYELGAGHWGGWSRYIRVPYEWAVPLPSTLSLREAMIYGTAGFTAAQSMMALERCSITPAAGQVVVTGATGGVGSLAVGLLSKQGFEVIASTGKANYADWLRSLGARQIIDRDQVIDTSPSPLLEARWAGAIDTVGGATLATLVRSMRHRGCVAACGLVGGNDLALTVFPFLLRGVTLAGIDSAKCPAEPRQEVWRRLAGPWKLDDLESLATTITLPEIGDAVERILAGGCVGRTLVDLEN